MRPCTLKPFDSIGSNDLTENCLFTSGQSGVPRRQSALYHKVVPWEPKCPRRSGGGGKSWRCCNSDRRKCSTPCETKGPYKGCTWSLQAMGWDGPLRRVPRSPFPSEAGALGVCLCPASPNSPFERRSVARRFGSGWIVIMHPLQFLSELFCCS